VSPAARRRKRRAPAGARKKRRPVTPKTPPLPEEPTHEAWHRRKAEESREMPAALGLLEVAVPLWMEQFRPMSWDERMKVRDACLGALCTGEGAKSGLDGIANLACGAKGKPGQVAEAFNALAKALALGALQPGGVTFGSMHFEDAPRPAPPPEASP
jgi:hypothetical protein